MAKKDLGRVKDGLFYNLDSREPYNRIHFDHFTSDKQHKGGDFCKAYKIPGGRYGFVVGDVPGHKGNKPSIENSISMILAFDRAVNNNIDRPIPHLIMNEVNEIISQYPDYFTEHFYPTVFSIYDINKRELDIVNAGHPKPIRVNKRKAETVGGTPQMVLGMADESYHSHRLKLDLGDRFYVITDGIHEAGIGKEGKKLASIIEAEDNLCKELKDLREMEMGDSIVELVKRIKKHNGIEYFEDDVTVAGLAVLA